MGKGGVHCGSPYLYSMKGKGGVQAQCNLDMLDSMAFTLNGLVGPWILGGDWNCTPQELADTGWRGGECGRGAAPPAARLPGPPELAAAAWCEPAPLPAPRHT